MDCHGVDPSGRGVILANDSTSGAGPTSKRERAAVLVELRVSTPGLTHTGHATVVGGRGAGREGAFGVGLDEIDKLAVVL